MSDIDISYKGSSIATMDASGTKTLETGGTYCEDDISIVYTKPSGSSFTKIAETTYTVSTTSTSAATVATWSTGDSSIWTSDKIVYVKIRDKAGKRAGYFYGSDTFYINYLVANGSTSTSTYNGSIRIMWTYTTSNQYNWRYGYSSTGYGVYPNYIYSDGRIQIRSRYNSTYSLTIDGTYKVEVYLLEPPSAIFT